MKIRNESFITIIKISSALNGSYSRISIDISSIPEYVMFLKPPIASLFSLIQVLLDINVARAGGSYDVAIFFPKCLQQSKSNC